jgi:hypothetical protein
MLEIFEVTIMMVSEWVSGWESYPVIYPRE